MNGSAQQVDDRELDRLAHAIAQQIIAGYSKARRNTRNRNGFQIIINVQNGQQQALIQWPPEITSVIE